MTTGPPHDTGIDAAILDRMTDTLIILQAKSATTDRGKMIAALQALRGRHPDAQVILVESESDARVIRECLQSIERTSLGTPSARRTRAKATADRIADILIRHQELPESNDGVVPTNHDDRDEDARLEVMQTAHRDVADAIQRHNLPLIPGPKPPADYRETGDSLQDSPVGALQISRHQTGFWDELTALGVIGHQAATWREQIQGLLWPALSAELSLQPGCGPVCALTSRTGSAGWRSFGSTSWAESSPTTWGSARHCNASP